MVEELNEIMVEEFHALNNLLTVLEEQHSAYVKKDLFALEGIVKKIENHNVTIAKLEFQRRKIIEGNEMKALVRSFNNQELDKNYRNLIILLEKIKLQKDTNELLIKQGIMFTNKMLNIFRPSKMAKTYNNYGKFNG